jgi:tRNA (uracil-5-)-methyltransferase
MDKFKKFKLDISQFYLDKININLSPSSSHRSRCEFSYLNGFYVMHDDKSKIFIETFEKASSSIQKIMPILVNEINNSELLSEKLFQINFRSNASKEVLITMIYHKKLSNELQDLIDKLNTKMLKPKARIILRAKKEIYPNQDIFFKDTIELNNREEKLIIYQTDNCFYQPNSFLLPKMIEKVLSYTDFSNNEDLIELYCGVGTFSLPLSDRFNKVFATENNRSSIKCLKKGVTENNINNLNLARLSSSEVVELFNGRSFNRMNNVDINSYNFSHVLVDPPRSGLTDDVIKLIKKFDNIIYISCNPETYTRDIRKLNNHSIKNIELFDQFPNTNHLEIISLLSIN